MIDIVSNNDYLDEVRILFLIIILINYLLLIEILILNHCNVFYALARSSDDEQVELIIREKTRQEREEKKNCLLNNAGHNRTPSGLTTSSIHSR
jgi:hypothetical protein